MSWRYQTLFDFRFCAAVSAMICLAHIGIRGRYQVGDLHLLGQLY
jgi:hypothetical protein